MNNYFEIKECKLKTSEILAKCREKFDVYSYFNDKRLDKDFPPPKKLTVRYFKKNIEADEEYNGMSADDLKEKGIEGINLRERLLMELDYFEETGSHLDIDNITLCSGSRDSDGSVPGVHWDAGFRRLYVRWYDPDCRLASLRARAIVIPESSTLNPFSELELRVKNLEDIVYKWREALIKTIN